MHYTLHHFSCVNCKQVFIVQSKFRGPARSQNGTAAAAAAATAAQAMDTKATATATETAAATTAR